MTGRIARPVFRSQFRVLTAGDDTLVLMSEADEFIVCGRAYAALAPLIDGTKTADELVRMVRDAVPPAEAYYALMQLEHKGYLAEANESLPSEEAAFWHALGIDAHAAAERIRNGNVRFLAFGALDPAPLADKLRRASIRTAATAEESTLDIVLTDDYLREEVSLFHEQARSARRPWLLAKPIGSTIWIGPVFRPQQETACWECLAHRLRSNQKARGLLAEHQVWSSGPTIPQAATPAAFETALHLIATETGKLLAQGEGHALHNSLLSLDLLTLHTQTHTLVRRPQCPVCGDNSHAVSRTAEPLVLQSRSKHGFSEGGTRTVTPEETLRRYGHHVSPITGIIKKIEVSHVRFSQHVIHNAFADANAAFLQSGSLDTLHQHLRSRSAGKGVTELQARVGALCEAIERYSGVFQGEERRIQASYRELGDQAIHPREYLLFSEQQYDNRERINSQRLSMFQWIPHRFDEERVIEWTPLWSLTEQRTKYLPTSACYYSYPQPPSDIFALADSNGAASGNTLEEAVLQGFFELVERDAVAVWWYNRLRRERVDLDSFQHPYVAKLQAFYRQELQREVWVLNLTHDLGIPTFAAISRQVNLPAENLILGFGAHFDPEVALLRALTEMNQSLPLAGQGSVHAQIAQWWRTATVQNQPYLLPNAALPAKRAADFPFLRHEDLLEDVRLAKRIAEEHGLEMLVLDQTRPDVGLPVVKVVVPGLRHFWTRFAPGRLYDVPVRMNLLPAPLAEEELNPMPMFM